ncbi:hypothetical protein PIB30_081393 [Stylosanthes scabra]|uniref:Protein SHORTAGE IN CHIASMATA 1 n=1 Tax=Stylosanthes scabra TaxID=79078 RepID=A0ABU6XS68_9FABA|nr:hypothetical protein [Stylosanthes scabra]
MRTRFLNNDYFALPPSQRFLHLPVPRLHDPPSSAVHDTLRFDSTLPVSHHIEPLPIAAALSTFLSCVLPHKYHVELRDLEYSAYVESPARDPDPDRSSSFSCGSCENRNPEQEVEASFEENGRESCEGFCSGADIKFSKESNRIDCGDKSMNTYEVIQFETPELDALLENGCFTEKERAQMLHQTPEVENCLEMFKPEPSMQFPYEALEAIPLVENAISEYLKVEDACSFEDNISVRHPSHSGQNMFLNLEVDEESLGIPTCLSMVEIVGTYFDSTKSLNFDEECQTIMDGKSTSYDMVKLFSDECTSKQSLVLSHMSPESDLINMLETEHFGVLQGISQANSNFNLVMNLVTFQEFVFLDEDFTRTIEAFYHKSSSHILESSNWMFEKEFNLKNFDELIVSNEITLIDDKFKSLPVPVISDCKKLLALHDIIQELFSNLKTRPLSASDGIYLNWDLLEEDECNYKISNDHDNKQSVELQKLLSDSMSLHDISPTEFASVKQLERGSSIEESQEPLLEKGAGRASMLFKSMSEISSLDYFLNPQKATGSRESNFAVESTDAKACFPEVTPANIEYSRVAAEADDFVPPIAASKTDHGHRGMELFNGSVIIVNTQNVDKEVIFSRRSSYQAILAMEKGGIQVVERDMDLPVDIILSSAICLAWYDSINLAKKATPVTEASSSLHLCIENIAADVLTLLSFYFCGCFLVFEGEFNFLSTVMEFSDGLYAAAASLGIDLQIFFSYSPELTTEVIISCIKSATKSKMGLYPKMTESVTLAESFLTQFPGVNPLTAHSILSSGVTLNEFLSCSHEQRMHVLEKYNVPEESISLFSVFCRYGEREDSKSIMTDCSSSVSSEQDSDKCYLYHQVDHERKRKTRTSSNQMDELCLQELLQFNTSNQVAEAVPDSSAMPKFCDLGMPKDAGRSNKLGNASSTMEEFFEPRQRSSMTTMRNPASFPQSSCDLWNFDAAPVQVEQSRSSLKSRESSQNDMLATAMMDTELNWHNPSGSEKMHEDIRGEVVDFTDCPLLDKDFSVSDFMKFPNLTIETEKDHMRKNKIVRRLSFDGSFHPEANPSMKCRSSKDTQQEFDNYAEPAFGKDAPLGFKHSQNILEEGLTQTSMENLQRLPFQEEMSHLGRTPLSRARWSTNPVNSPWTTEFMNRFKEKSKLRQKSLSSGISAPCYGYPGNTSNVSKRRSPSIIELFKYQSGETLGNIQQKRQKQSGQSSKPVKRGKYSVSLPSYTPNDKISTKTLTFGRNGSGSQTKLVWSDRDKSRYRAQ